MSQLELRGVTKRFASADVETTALDNIQLRVEAGDFLAILGPSGCGKSTLLHILGLLDTPTDGTYLFEGIDSRLQPQSQLTKMRAQKIGFIFQSFNLIESLSVRENIALPLKYQGFKREQCREPVEKIMEHLGIFHRRNHAPSQLSGGQQQRVAIARAVVSGPSLLLCDEPTGNLDTANGAEVMNILHTLNDGGTTIVMVTHSLHHASEAKRTVSLLDGRVLQPALESA